MSTEQARWYVLHTYSGYESMVKENLHQLVENHNLQNDIFDVVIPMEQAVEEKKGKRKVVMRKLLPCYVFIKLVYSNNVWFLVTNTRGVTGFVGPMGKPLPLTDEEVKRMKLEKAVEDFSLAAGDNVRIRNGPLENFFGLITEVNPVSKKAKVKVSMFSRETEVELEFLEIEKI